MTWKKLAGLAVAAILVGAASGAAFFALALVLPFVRVAESWTVDLRIAALSPPRPQDDRIVVVAITEETLALLPVRSPLDRGFLADLLEHLESAGPAAIGLDFLLDQPSEPAKDERLKSVLRRLSAPMIVAWASRDDGLTENQAAHLAGFADGLGAGLVNLVTDSLDGTVRWVFPGRRTPTGFQPSFAAAIASAVGARAPEDVVALAYRGPTPDGAPEFRIHAAHTVAHLPKPWFRGKIVLIGGWPSLSEDRPRTPFAAVRGAAAGRLPGILIHAHALSQILDGRTLPAIEKPAELGLVVAAGVAGGLFALLDMGLAARVAAFVATVVLSWAGGFALFRYGGPLVPLVLPSLGFGTAFGVGAAYFRRDERRQKTFIRQAFARYVSPSVVARLVEEPSLLRLGGEKRELSYLFTDLAGFTTLAEAVEPAVLVPVLNEYLDAMCRIVFKHGGTLDKIVGDAVVGFFNAPLDQPDHAERAASCALELDAFAEDFRRRKNEAGVMIGVTRIGINTGTAVIGNFGGDVFFNYTGHGDMVNTAARLEGVNKYLGTRICVSETTARRCNGVAFRPIGSLVLKGKVQALPTFEPLKPDRAASPSIAAYHEAYRLLEADDPGARRGFACVLKLDRHDPLARFHWRRLYGGERGTTIVFKEK